MRKIVISGMIGNALEWYDYALYAQFATIIGSTFFPKSPLTDILTFAAFAAGFVVRPLGGVLFGQIGDRYGRRVALIVGIILMAIPTAGIGLLPAYSVIGIAAPILLVIMRLMQGFSLGGEFSGCIAYIVEHSPAEKRGLAGSASFVSMCLGMLLGLITANIFRFALSAEDLVSWGWRVPFIIGLAIGIVGLYIRTRLSESPVYKAAKARGALSATPFRDTMLKHWRHVLVALVIYANLTAPFYASTVYAKTYMTKLGYVHEQGALASSLILISMSAMFPISAYISDKIGRKPVIVWSGVALVLCTIPVFMAVHSMNYNLAILSLVIYSVIIGAYMGPVPTLLIELFPTRVRYTGVALSYNLAAAIFGGTVPLIGSILHKWTGDQFTLAYYLTGLSIVCLSGLYFYQETYMLSLTDDNMEANENDKRPEIIQATI